VAASARGGPATAAIAAACALLTVGFAIAGFPYEALSRRLAFELETRTGTMLAHQSVEGFFSFAGPGVVWTGLSITTADGTALAFDTARVRPAWSLAWLRLAPALRLDLDGPAGQVHGVATLGRLPGFRGDLAEVDLSALPADRAWPGAAVAGRGRAAVDLRAGPERPEGSVSFEASEGNLAVQGLPVALPFAVLRGDLALGGEGYVEIRALRAEGPLFTADAKGRIGSAERFAQAPLEIDLELQADPRFAATLEQVGIRGARGGPTTLRVRGTPEAPEVR
jgi:type II secretion system protein N